MLFWYLNVTKRGMQVVFVHTRARLNKEKHTVYTYSSDKFNVIKAEQRGFK